MRYLLIAFVLGACSSVPEPLPDRDAPALMDAAAEASTDARSDAAMRDALQDVARDRAAPLDSGGSCVDRDGDGYGVGPGCVRQDCDDNNRLVKPLGIEVCNGRDDDCDGRIDDHLSGDPCTVGVGGCARQGTIVCDPSPTGGIYCNATAGRPTAESCNGVDDDCDGRIDDGNLCLNGACTAGACACPTTAPTLCGASCVDLQTNPFHCGACGNWCGGLVCRAGRCECPKDECPSPVGSGRACFDLQTNPYACGSCTNVCPGVPNARCVMGVCQGP